MIKRTVEQTIILTPEELAAEFAGMSSRGQAVFFNELERISTEWALPFRVQIQSVVGSSALTDEGRAIMRTIGEYGKGE